MTEALVSEDVKIDLNEVRNPPRSGLLSGRDAGIAARAHFHLDKLDAQDVPVEVVIPDEVFSLNTSFFLGLFGDSVRSLGPEGFRKKYRFILDESVHGMTINRGIQKAMKEGNVFPEKKTA
jgi:hypothetical protein